MADTHYILTGGAFGKNSHLLWFLRQKWGLIEPWEILSGLKALSSLLNHKCNWSFKKPPALFTRMMTRNLETPENFMIGFSRHCISRELTNALLQKYNLIGGYVSSKSDHQILWCFQIPCHHVGENYRWFYEWSITFLVQQRWHVLMQVFSSQSISYTHIGIPWLYIFLPSRRSKIWNKTVHSFHSLEENIGDICDDLQKMCFVVVFLKKNSFEILTNLQCTWLDWLTVQKE